MTVQELYYKFKLLYNKNNEAKDINIPIENFVLLYNKIQEDWLREYILLHKSTSEIFKINELIKNNFEAEPVSETKERIEYLLPEDYFDIVIGSIKSKPSNCSNYIYNFLYKNEDLNSILTNKFTRPSISWERGVASISDGRLIIHLNNFSIDKTLFSYYIKPQKIDMEGYIKFDNTHSKDIHPIYSEFITHNVLEKVVTEVQRQFENQVGFQLSKDREI